MSNDNLPERKSLRLKGYDYSQNGTYFVTACVNNGKKLLGYVDTDCLQRVGTGLCARPQELIHLTELGKEVEKSLLFIQKKYNGKVTLETYSILPNHVHILLSIDNTKVTDGRGDPSLREIIGSFKSYTTYVFRKNGGSGTFWQERFYEHIIRNDEDFSEKFEYITYNPLKWIEKHYPKEIKE